MAHRSFLGRSDGQLSARANVSFGVTACSQPSLCHPAQGPKCSSGESGRQRAEAVEGRWPMEEQVKQARVQLTVLYQVMTLGAGLIKETRLPKCCLCN